MRWTTEREDGTVEHRKVRRTSPCGKAVYRTKKIAKQMAAARRKATGELIEAYRCPHGCHAWHIGHPPGSRGEHTRAA